MVGVFSKTRTLRSLGAPCTLSGPLSEGSSDGVERAWTRVLSSECEVQLCLAVACHPLGLPLCPHFEVGAQTLRASSRGVVGLACVPKEQG